jgi:hypothetical protein
MRHILAQLRHTRVAIVGLQQSVLEAEIQGQPLGEPHPHPAGLSVKRGQHAVGRPAFGDDALEQVTPRLEPVR